MDRRIIRSAALVAALLVCLAQTWGQNARPVYTIQDCIDIALKNNVDIKNAQANSEGARLASKNFFGQRIPTVSINGTQAFNAGYTIDPFTNQFINQNIRSNNFSLFSQVVLFQGNSINNNTNRLRAAARGADYSFAVTRNQVTLDVAQFYTALLTAYKVESATAARLQRVRTDRDRLRIRVEAQAAAKSDLADLDAQVATEEFNLSRAQGDIVRQKLLLAQRMLIPTTDFDIAIPQIESLLAEPADTNVERVYASALEILPEVKLANTNVEAAQYAERAARGFFYPTITAQGSIVTGYSSARTKVVPVNNTGGGPVLPSAIYLRDTAGQVFQVPTALFQNQRTFNSVDYPFRNQLNDNINRGLTLQASIPILNRFTARTNTDNARIQRIQAQNDVQRTRQNIYNAVALAITEYKIALANLKSADNQLKSLNISLQAAKTRYDAGAGSSFDLLAQQSLLAASQANLVQTQFNVLFRKLVIDFYQGRPLKL